MTNFAIKLGGARQANAAVLEYLRTCPWAVEWKFWYHQIVNFDDTELTLPAATTYEIDLNALYTRNVFPEDVDILPGAKARRITDFAGGAISDFDVEVGDTGDPNGLLTASDVFGEGAGYDVTPAAAEYARHYESAFAPTLTLTSAGANINVLTAGACEVWIPWAPLKEL